MNANSKPPSSGLPSVLVERRNQAQQFIENQQSGNNWKASAETTLVSFAQIRSGMCRWPIGDPHNLETFRFCGSVCAAEVSYCETHRNMAHTPSRAKAAPPTRLGLAYMLTKAVG